MSEEGTRETILQAAKELFTTKGFANTSVREICEAAGITPPVVYYYFGNKEGLFEAVVESSLTLDSFCDLLRREVERHADPWDKLRAYVNVYLTHFPTQMLNPGLHLGNSTQLNGTSLRQFGSGLEAIYNLARDILGAGVAAGALREVDVDTMAACLVGTVDSFVRARAYLGAEYDPEDVTDNIVDLYQRGLAASTTSSPA